MLRVWLAVLSHVGMGAPQQAMHDPLRKRVLCSPIMVAPSVLRRTPLKRGTSQLKRTPLERKTPLKAKQKVQKGWAKCVKTIRQRSGDVCEAQVEGVCVQHATISHHKLKRSQGGLADPAYVVRVCWACDVFIEANPAKAYEAGLLIRSTDIERVSKPRPEWRR